MGKVLNVLNSNGESIEINVLDTFTVDEYPNRQYIAYTLDEKTDDGYIKVYMSILSGNETAYRLDRITDKEELEIVEEAFENMVAESEASVNEQ